MRGTMKNCVISGTITAITQDRNKAVLEYVSELADFDDQGTAAFRGQVTVPSNIGYEHGEEIQVLVYLQKDAPFKDKGVWWRMEGKL